MKKNPTYGSLHDYIKYYKKKPDKCGYCGEEKKLDLANKSGQYKRDLDDWEWLCRRCHMIKDEALQKLLGTIYNRPKESYQKGWETRRKKFGSRGWSGFAM